MGKEELVLGKVFGNANVFGFSFVSGLDMDAKKITVGKYVAVKGAYSNGVIIAKIRSRTKAEDDYYCECENVILIDKNGTPVDDLTPPLMRSSVYGVEKIDFACEKI